VNPTDYIFDVLSNYRLIIIFSFVYPLLLICNKILYQNFFNGLVVLVFASSIVFSVFIDLWFNNVINSYKLLYFIFSDFSIYIIVLLLYKFILNKIDKKVNLAILKNINDKYFYIAVIWLLFGIIINLQNVSWDGGSRIAFQTARWYSFYRMISILINPTVGLLLIYNLYNNNKVKLSIMLLLTIFISASGGSKSGFVFSLIMSYLLYKDLIFVSFKLKSKIVIPLVLFVTFAAILNFYLIGVDSDKVFERLVHYAESTIMVFPSDNPCAACEKQSTIALLHRGFGRLFNDPSSLNDNNLFGFALSSEFYGGESMTGPNARIGSYSICAFPGFKIVVLYIIFIVLVSLNFLLIKITKQKKSFIYISSLLIVIDTLQHFILDYNVAMSNLTLVLIIYLFIISFDILKSELSKNEIRV
jgi:hypothetical protein